MAAEWGQIVFGDFSEIEELDDALPPEDIRRLPLPWPAGFLAGRCFVLYRRRGGARRSPLPDFYIGAHAAVAGLCLRNTSAKYNDRGTKHRE